MFNESQATNTETVLHVIVCFPHTNLITSGKIVQHRGLYIYILHLQNGYVHTKHEFGHPD